jgi:hypothetical protein
MGLLGANGGPGAPGAPGPLGVTGSSGGVFFLPFKKCTFWGFGAPCGSCWLRMLVFWIVFWCVGLVCDVWGCVRACVCGCTHTHTHTHTHKYTSAGAQGEPGAEGQPGTNNEYWAALIKAAKRR